MSRDPRRLSAPAVLRSGASFDPDVCGDAGGAHKDPARKYCACRYAWCRQDVTNGNCVAWPKKEEDQRSWATALWQNTGRASVIMTEMTAGVDRFHRDHWDPQKLKHGRRITVKGPPTRAFGDVKESIAARKRIADREVMRVELMGTVNQLDIPQDARNLLKEAPCTLKTGSIEAEEMQKKLIRAQTELAEEKKIVEGLRVHATNLRRCIERLTKKHGWMSYDSLHNSKEMQRDMGDWFFFEDMPTLDAFMNWILHECPEEHWNWYAGIAEDAFGEDEAEGDDGGDGSGDDDGADGSSDDSGDGSSSTSSHEDSDDESCDGGGEGDRDAGAGDGPRKRRRRQSGMGKRTHLSCRDAVMLFLVTVRAGLTFKRVGKLFGCHYTTASRAFVTVLSLLKTIFKYTFHQLDTETLQGLVPDSFRNAETEEGEVHLVHLFDAFELFCQKPFSDIMRLIMWSEVRMCFEPFGLL